MEHQLHDDLSHAAKLYRGNLPPEPMSRLERLDRWVKVLDRQPGRTLHTLYQTEHRPREIRYGMRRDNTAITVAFEDPLLRSEGLQGDTYGDAKRFFGLSDRQLHLVVCYCRGGVAMPAATAARRLEALLSRKRNPQLFRRALWALRRRFRSSFGPDRVSRPS